MNFPKIFKGGGITKSHLQNVIAAAERITLKRMRDQEEEIAYKEKRAKENAKAREAAEKKASK